MIPRFTPALPVLACALALATSPRAAGEDPSVHSFTNYDGRTIRGRVVSYEKGEARVLREDGQTVALAVADLTAADEAYLDSWKRQQGLKPPVGSTASPGLTANAHVTAEALNTALGQPLLPGPDPLWKAPPESVASRLKWPRESQTPTQASFRAYPGESYRFAGARPFSAALYGEGGQSTSLSLVFANRGDSFGAKGSAEEHFDRDEPLPADALGRLKAAIKADADAIAATLTGVLGEAEKQNYGEGEGRRRVRRWDWLGHAFLLSEEDEQYVGLTVVPSEFADQRGKTARISDAAVRERIRASVERRPHGDVVVTHIPMVDQGPKGYCAPATCERAMRHVGMTADMYLLAVAGGTGLGGGVSVERMLQAVGRDIKRKGRSFETFDGPLSLKRITKYLDDGLPVLWVMDSAEAFNELANARTKERKTVTDWEAWKQKLAADTEGAAIASDGTRSHCTMIIGYNRETGEIAFSDSWGARFAERWVRLEEAQAVSKGAFYVIGL
jgi:hypothetical protein